MKNLILFSMMLAILEISSLSTASAQKKSEMSQQVLQVINRVSDCEVYDQKSLKGIIKGFPTMSLARIAVIADALVVGDAATIHTDERWQNLFWAGLATIRDRREEDPEDLLKAFSFVQQRTIQDGGLSLNLREMIEEVTSRKSTPSKQDDR